MQKLSYNSVLSEANEKFDKNPGECKTSGTKLHNYPVKVGRKRLEVRCFDAQRQREDMVVELEKFGPFAHDLVVFDSLLNCHYEQGLIREDTKCLKIEEDRKLGYTSVIFAGYEDKGSKGLYFHVKFHFGEKFGWKGYLKLHDELLYKYFPDCKEHLQRLKTDSKKLPFIFFTNKYNNVPPGVRSLIDARRLRDQTSMEDIIPFRVREGTETELTQNKKAPASTIPYLFFAIRALLYHDMPDNLAKEFETSKYCYSLNRVVHADLVVVSGKKLFLVLELRRAPRSYGCIGLDFRDEAVNKERGYTDERIYFSAEVWLPLPTSDISGHSHTQNSIVREPGFMASRVSYVTLNRKFHKSGSGLPSGGWLWDILGVFSEVPTDTAGYTKLLILLAVGGLCVGVTQMDNAVERLTVFAATLGQLLLEIFFK